MWSWIIRTKKEASETPTFQADDHRGLPGGFVYLNGWSENKPAKSNMREVETLPFRVTGITTGRTTFTGLSRGSGIRANTLATDAVPSPATEHSILRDAGVRAGGAVTVLACPAGPAHAFTAVTHAVICKTNAP